MPESRYQCSTTYCLPYLLLIGLACGLFTASQAAEKHTTRALEIGGETWDIRLPQGMLLEVLTTRLDSPRLMSFLPNGDLLIGSKSDRVYRLAPPYSRPTVLLELDTYPHSVAWRDGELLIARTDGLYRVPYKPGQPASEPDDVQLVADLPSGGGHSSRSVGLGPHGPVSVSLGIRGNCPADYLDDSYPFDDRRGGVHALVESGRRPALRPFASGLRNPVGLAWHPTTGELYASNNGPDHLGFEQPPEYFSRLLPGSFHGMPWFQFDGETIQRDECLRKRPPRSRGDVAIPVAPFPARNAPMGVAFVPETALDGRFQNNALVALKGSWGTLPSGGMSGARSTRRPPALVMVRFSGGEAAEVVTVVSGFQRADGERLARPVGVAIGPDDSLYFTSDSHTAGLFRLRPVPPVSK